MADTLPYFGQQPGTQAAFPSTQQIIFETEFRRRTRDLSLIDKLTSHNFKGRFRNSGFQIRRPVMPLLKSKKRRPGDPVVYQELQGKDEVFTINRERDIAFHINVEDKLFCPQNLDSRMNREAQAQFTEDRDLEFFADIPFKSHTANCGNAAGIRSGMYELGTSTEPLYVYKTDSEAAAARATKTHTASATEAITNMVAALEEWPGGSMGEVKVVVPTCIQNRLINSELKYADRMGDQLSVLRKGIKYIGDVAGANVIGCNQMPMWNEDTENDLPKRFLCMFLNTQAIEFVDEITIDENMKDKDQYGMFYRSLGIYDWFASYPELMGYAIIALG